MDTHPYLFLALSAAGVLIALATLTYTILVNRSKASGQKFSDLELKVSVLIAEIDMTKDRVLKVESELEHLPDKDVTHRLELSLSKMENELGKIAERIRPISHMADRMQEAMMEKVMS